jgi:hypothetical protein
MDRGCGKEERRGAAEKDHENEQRRITSLAHSPHMGPFEPHGWGWVRRRRHLLSRACSLSWPDFALPPYESSQLEG